MARRLGLKSFGIIVRPRSTEWAVAVVSEPSLLAKKKFAVASRNTYTSLIGNQRQWNRRLSQAKRDYRRALSIPANSNTNRSARASGLREATANANQAQSKLNVINGKLPAAKLHLDDSIKDFNKLLGQFDEIREGWIGGDCFQRAAKHSVLVMRLNGKPSAGVASEKRKKSGRP